MKKRMVYLILLIITLILEIIPYGAVCNFAHLNTNGEIERIRELYSYFDLLPFGYANFAPFITAIITCIVFILLVIYCITGKTRIAMIARKILWVCIVFSLGPLVFGISYFSVVGILITGSLIIEVLFLNFVIKKNVK